jgi:hypothetical protein
MHSEATTRTFTNDDRPTLEPGTNFLHRCQHIHSSHEGEGIRQSGTQTFDTTRSLRRRSLPVTSIGNGTPHSDGFVISMLIVIARAAERVTPCEIPDHHRCDRRQLAACGPHDAAADPGLGGPHLVEPQHLPRPRRDVSGPTYPGPGDPETTCHLRVRRGSPRSVGVQRGTPDLADKLRTNDLEA